MKTLEDQRQEWEDNELKVRKMYCEDKGKTCDKCDNEWCKNRKNEVIVCGQQ